MAEGFANSIIGGAETLIRSAIKSVNYVLGVAGWRISRDGDAELNDVTVRGQLIVSNGDAYIQIFVDGANNPAIDLMPEAIGGSTIAPGQIYALSTAGGTNRVKTLVESPTIDFPNHRASIELEAADSGVTTANVFGDAVVVSSSVDPINIVSAGVSMPQWDGGQVSLNVIAGDAARNFVNAITFNYPYVNPPALVVSLFQSSGNFARWTARITGVTNTTANIVLEKGAAADANMAANSAGVVNWVAMGS